MYVGLDIVSNSYWLSWPSSSSELRRVFVKSEAEKLPFEPMSINFALSSCAMEHFDDDFLAIKKLNEVMQPNMYSLHFVPSIWSLFLYVYHGYRRYSPAGLMEMFEETGFKVIKLWALGGMLSFLLHYFWITWLEMGNGLEILLLGSEAKFLRAVLSKLMIGPRVRQQPRFVSVYNYLLKWCLKLDRFFPYLPGGYAVLIQKPS